MTVLRKCWLVLQLLCLGALIGLPWETDTAHSAAPNVNGVGKDIPKISPAPTAPIPPPLYRFAVDRFTVNETRAFHEDTDFVTIVVDGGSRTKALGDVNNGTHDTSLFLDRRANPGNTLRFSYVILNSGRDPAYVSKRLEAIVAGVRSAIGLNFSGVLTGGCDGLVAKGEHNFTATDLATLTANGKVISGKDYTAGTDSPAGCGGNSKYYVEWSITRLP
jgi:hypothetical protein